MVPAIERKIENDSVNIESLVQLSSKPKYPTSGNVTNIQKEAHIFSCAIPNGTEHRSNETTRVEEIVALV